MPPSAESLPWPPALLGTPTVAVIERAIQRQRLAHSLLLHGENLSTLATVAHAIADRLLNDPRDGTQYFSPKQHPDFLALRPAGKSRQIGAEVTRESIGRIQISPQISRRKVLVIYEADRMNLSAANIFLKTLEEPTASTTILLLTTRPYSLLPTIRSRCLHFRFTDAGHEALADAEESIRELWKSTLADYATWLGQLAAGQTDKRMVADQVLAVYGLITRFNAVLSAATDQIWKQQKAKLPDELDDDEQAAIETGIANGIRSKLFAEIEHATRNHAQQRLLEGDESARRILVAAIGQLEHDSGLLRLNLNESAALENFLLSSLRIWARAK
ncbi:DNA polymerase III subunit delta' [Lacunisphaera limnophila]|uniref:DNA polymerase III subunit delta n=1 Tax=Lacunisphaera limnophila TaxID=1838286 RepID=A0A1D8AY54_9BACT|nr:DNA polymerase III subunit gamma/tau [Lacunisphaera limnophila]AOS45822.1 DNA polymerase III subunit delta' [Lacunisphaera limnophila]